MAAQSRRADVRATVACAIVVATVSHAVAAFDLQGHRGARGLAPENTMAAFRKALAIGVTTIETDLAITKDGVIVIAHDRLLNADLVRGPDGRWLTERGPAIHTLSAQDLQRYDIGRVNPASAYAKQFAAQEPADGERIPKLAELFDLVAASGKPVRFNLETKLVPDAPSETPDPGTFARIAVRAVRDAGMANRVTIQSFDWRTLREVNRLAPEIPTACLTIETERNNNVKPDGTAASAWTAGFNLQDYDGSVPRLVKAAGCAIWSPFWRDVTPARIAAAHTLGLTVLPWTVNDPAEMTRLIAMKVDGLITDYPDRLRAVLADKRMPLP